MKNSNRTDIEAEAQACFYAGDLHNAAMLFNSILEQDPANPNALHSLGVIHNLQGDYHNAIKFISEAIAIVPNYHIFHINIAEAYRNAGRLRRALGCCRTALKLCPDFPDGLTTLGLVLQGLGKLDEAADVFSQLIHRYPGMASAYNNFALLFQELNSINDAIAYFKRALELDPTLVRAHTNLGLALLKNGQAEEALQYFREAVRLEPDTAIFHHNLGNALRNLDRPAEARAAYLEALRIDPNMILAHLQIGLTLKREGQLNNALTWYKLAIDLDPNNFFLWEQLADLHGERDETSEAILCWKRAMSLSKRERAVAHLGLGGALHEDGLLNEALKHYQRASQLEPDSAAALINIGNVHEELGNMVDAEAAFRNASMLQPDHPLPYARLGILLRDKLPNSDLIELEARLADPILKSHARARLLFALAHVLDARGDYRAAAHRLREANALTLSNALGYRAYEVSAHRKFVDLLLQHFNADFFARTGVGSSSRKPVFVFGLPRSGTTLIEQILSSHACIHGAGELRLARKSFESIPQIAGLPLPPIDCIPHVSSETIRKVYTNHLKELTDLIEGCDVQVIDKMPDNYLYLGLLAAMFPKATFIHCRRDLRDVAVSCWMTDFRSVRWANDFTHIASRFSEYSRIMAHWRSVLPISMIEVDYEETVDDLETVARRLLTACGQAWDPSCLEFYRTHRRVRTASVTQVRKPIYKRSVARWKNYEFDMNELFQIIYSL
jgi:tetratricopeptide (TPR) repeat protein